MFCSDVTNIVNNTGVCASPCIVDVPPKNFCTNIARLVTAHGYKLRQHRQHYNTVRYKIPRFAFVTVINEPLDRFSLHWRRFFFVWTFLVCVISVYRSGANKICALMGLYAASNGNCVPIGCPEPAIRSHSSTLRKIVEKRRCHIWVCWKWQIWWPRELVYVQTILGEGVTLLTFTCRPDTVYMSSWHRLHPCHLKDEDIA